MTKRNLIYCPDCGAGKEYDEVEGRCLQCGAALTGLGVTSENFIGQSYTMPWDDETLVEEEENDEEE